MASPTIREVADHAGVSVGTVSNVLNGRGRVRDATRKRVEAAVEALGYRPNAIAQSLISRRSQAGGQTPRTDAPRLSSVGYLSVDYIARLPVLPHRADRVTAERIERRLGGPAANVAVTAAGLGPPFELAVEVITPLGYDADSDWALGELAGRGVSTVGIERRPGQRLSRAIVFVEPDGSRTIVNEPVHLAPTDIAHYLGRTEGSRQHGTPHGLHIEGFQVPALLDSLPEVRAAGVTASMHGVGLPESWHTRAGLARLVSGFDLVFLNRDIAQAMVGRPLATPDLIAEMRRETAGHPGGPGALLVITLDCDGAVVIDRDGRVQEVPAQPVEVVDQTGAGDALAGAFLAAWLNGVAPVTALRWGVAAASHVVAEPGPQVAGLDAATLTAGGAPPVAADALSPTE